MKDQQKKKLLIIITKSNFGGAQRYVFDLSRSLKDTYDVVVACGGEGLMKQKIEALGIRTISIPFLGRNINPLKDLAMFFWLAKLIKKEAPAVLHVNSSKIGGAGAFVGRVMRVPNIIFTAHAWAFNEDRTTLSKNIIRFFHWLTVFFSHKTIAVSNAVKRDLDGLPFLKNKMVVVHLGLENITPLERLEARAKLGISNDVFAIGTIAELHPVKGLDYALDALKDLSFEYSYNIIGTGDLHDKLHEKIASSDNLKKHVTLSGFIQDAATYISAFDVFLLPSISEAFGYVILEAGFSKVPVIASSVGGIPEIIEDMKSGILIHSKNPKEISNSIDFIHKNKETAINLGKNLNEKVMSEFSLSKMVEKTVAVYEIVSN